MNRRNFLGLFVILPGAGRIWRAAIDQSPVEQFTPVEQFMFGVPSRNNLSFFDLPKITTPELIAYCHEIRERRLREGIPLVSDIIPMSMAEFDSRRQFFRHHLGL